MILCITHSNDFYTIDIVQQTLEQAGVPVFRLNTDELGTRYQLTYRLLQGKPEYALSTNGQTIYASDIKGVWYRKIWEFRVPPSLDDAWRSIFISEYQTLLHLFLNTLRGVPWINDLPAAHAVCHDKLYQLSAAHAAALSIPATLFTNEPRAVQNFFDQCAGRLVMKLHNPLSRSMKGDTPFFPTTKLSAEDLVNMESLALCPMIFQQYIPKMYELRIIYVEGTFFTGMIPADYNQVTDWRTITGHTIPWQPYELPLPEQEKISSLMQQLNLSFGAIDMIRQTDGQYVFLEVNPLGEWGMLQKYLGYPIGETIAQKLITRIHNESQKNTDHYTYAG